MCQLNWVTSSCQDEDYTLIETKIILLWDILSKRKKNQCSLTKLNRAIPRHSLLEKKKINHSRTWQTQQTSNKLRVKPNDLNTSRLSTIFLCYRSHAKPLSLDWL